MPATIELTATHLTVGIEGADKLSALKSRLRIPLANVTSADNAMDDVHKWLHGIRIGGTPVPGVISAGRFYPHGEIVFWDVHQPDKAIALALRDERYDRLVIQVEDPRHEILRVRQTVVSRQTTAASA